MAPIERIAICGGGIGGLTLAGVLSQNCDISVDIYETKPVLTDFGAGIAIWKRSWEVVQGLGLEEEVAKRKLPFPREGEASGPIFRKAGQPEPGFDFHNHVMPYGPTSIPRPMLIDMLKSRLNPKKCSIHTSKRLTEYRLNAVDGSITLVFADGTTATADVLIGADGVHSMTRASMYRSLAKADDKAGYEQFVDPIWSGTHAYRGSVDYTKFKALYPNHQALLQPKIWCGKSKHVVSVPIQPINAINIIGYYSVDTGEGTPYDGPWVSDVSTEEVVETYEGFEPDLMLLLKHLEKPSKWAIHVTRQLPLSVDGKIALLGDAAHAMTPHQGVGGGQAMEDAHILGHLLAHPKANINNVEEILRIYQEIRLPFVTKVVERSRNNGMIYEFMHPDYPVEDDATSEELKVLGEMIGETFEWLGRGGCDEDLKKAEGLFLSRCINV